MLLITISSGMGGFDWSEKEELFLEIQLSVLSYQGIYNYSKSDEKKSEFIV